MPADEFAYLILNYRQSVQPSCFPAVNRAPGWWPGAVPFAEACGGGAWPWPCEAPVLLVSGGIQLVS